MGSPVAEHSLLDQVHGVFDWRPPFHFAALDGRRVYHPHLPLPSPRVEEGPISGGVGGLELHSILVDK
jgi:hypothetical protein